VILADVLKYLLLVLGAMIVFVSYWLVAAALFPALVGQLREAYGARPLRLTLTGALVGIPLVLVGAGLMKSAPNAALKLVGAALAALPILLGLIGSAGLSERIGHGLVHADDVHSPWRRSFRGGMVLSASFLLPFIGWFVVLPGVVLSGFGAMLSAMRRSRRGHTPPVEPVT